MPNHDKKEITLTTALTQLVTFFKDDLFLHDEKKAKSTDHKTSFTGQTSPPSLDVWLEKIYSNIPPIYYADTKKNPDSVITMGNQVGRLIRIITIERYKQTIYQNVERKIDRALTGEEKKWLDEISEKPLTTVKEKKEDGIDEKTRPLTSEQEIKTTMGSGFSFFTSTSTISTSYEQKNSIQALFKAEIAAIPSHLTTWDVVQKDYFDKDAKHIKTYQGTDAALWLTGKKELEEFAYTTRYSNMPREKIETEIDNISTKIGLCPGGLMEQITSSLNALTFTIEKQFPIAIKKIIEARIPSFIKKIAKERKTGTTHPGKDISVLNDYPGDEIHAGNELFNYVIEKILKTITGKTFIVKPKPDDFAKKFFFEKEKEEFLQLIVETDLIKGVMQHLKDYFVDYLDNAIDESLVDHFFLQMDTLGDMRESSDYYFQRKMPEEDKKGELKTTLDKKMEASLKEPSATISLTPHAKKRLEKSIHQRGLVSGMIKSFTMESEKSSFPIIVTPAPLTRSDQTETLLFEELKKEAEADEFYVILPRATPDVVISENDETLFSSMKAAHCTYGILKQKRTLRDQTELDYQLYYFDKKETKPIDVFQNPSIKKLFNTFCIERFKNKTGLSLEDDDKIALLDMIQKKNQTFRIYHEKFYYVNKEITKEITIPHKEKVSLLADISPVTKMTTVKEKSQQNRIGTLLDDHFTKSNYFEIRIQPEKPDYSLVKMKTGNYISLFDDDLTEESYLKTIDAKEQICLIKKIQALFVEKKYSEDQYLQFLIKILPSLKPEAIQDASIISSESLEKLSKLLRLAWMNNDFSCIKCIFENFPALKLDMFFTPKSDRAIMFNEKLSQLIHESNSEKLKQFLSLTTISAIFSKEDKESLMQATRENKSPLKDAVVHQGVRLEIIEILIEAEFTIKYGKKTGYTKSNLSNTDYSKMGTVIRCIVFDEYLETTNFLKYFSTQAIFSVKQDSKPWIVDTINIRLIELAQRSNKTKIAGLLKIIENPIYAPYRKATLNQKDEKTGKTSLHYLASTGEITLINKMIQLGAEKDTVDNNQKTYHEILISEGISHLIEKNRYHDIILVLESTSNLEDQKSILEKSRLELGQLFITFIREKNDIQFNKLMSFLKNQKTTHPELYHGIINFQDEHGNTPIIYAAYHTNFHQVQALQEGGTVIDNEVFLKNLSHGLQKCIEQDEPKKAGDFLTYYPDIPLEIRENKASQTTAEALFNKIALACLEKKEENPSPWLDLMKDHIPIAKIIFMYALKQKNANVIQYILKLHPSFHQDMPHKMERTPYFSHPTHDNNTSTPRIEFNDPPHHAHEMIPHNNTSRCSSHITPKIMILGGLVMITFGVLLLVGTIGLSFLPSFAFISVGGALLLTGAAIAGYQSNRLFCFRRNNSPARRPEVGPHL